MKFSYQHNGETFALEAERDGDAWRVLLPDGTERRVTARRTDDDTLLLTEETGAGERTAALPFARARDAVSFAHDGGVYEFAPVVAGRPGRKAEAASGLLAAPMVGTVADVLVEAGQTVEAYQTLAVVEAMKVMARIDAPFAGVVKAVHARKGQRVEHGEPLIEVEPRRRED